MFRRVPRRAVMASVASASAILVHSPSDKLSIYPAPDREILLQETPSELEKQIGVARRAVTGVYNDAQASVQNVVSKWIGVEHAVEHRVKAIIAPEEHLTPALLYVGVATLTGSIITRTRSPVLRFLVPPAFFLVSLNQFLPKTSHNMREYLGGLEDAYVPNLAHKHDVSIAHTKMTWDLIKYHTRDSREKLSSGVVGAVGKVQDLTGLKLQEAFGWSKANVVTPAREVAEEKVQDVAEAVEEAKEVVEEKIEDIKRLV